MFVKPENNCDQITHVVEHIALNWSKTEMNTNAAILISWPLFRMHLCKAATTSWPTWKYTFFAMECYFQYIRNVDVARVSMLPPTNFVCITQVWAIAKWHTKRQASKLSIMSGTGCSKVCIWIAWGNKRAWEKKTQSKAHLKAVPKFPHRNRGTSEQQALLPHQPLWSLWSSSAKSLNWVQSVAQEMRRWNLSPVIDQQQVEIRHLPLPQS